MTVDRWIHVLAGTFILLSLALGIAGSPLFVSPWWLAFTVVVGANLLLYGASMFCPMALILRKLGVRDGVACAR